MSNSNTTYVLSVSAGTGCYRHIQLDAQTTLWKLHQVILEAFGYENTLESVFVLDGRSKDTIDLFLPTEENSRTLSQTDLESGKKIKYICGAQTFLCKCLRTEERQVLGPEVIRSVGQLPLQFQEVTVDLGEDGMPKRYPKSQTEQMFAALTLPKTTVRELRSYFAAAARLYGVLPLRKLLEIYNSQNPTISQEDFLAVAEVIRHEKNSYAILGQENRMRHVAPSRPMDREVVADYCYTMGWEEYDELIESQQGKSYYIPEKQELLRYADDAYYAESPEQEAMKRYLLDKLDQDRDKAMEMRLELLDCFYRDARLQDAVDRLGEMGLRFVSEADVRRFSDLAGRLGNSVRRPSLRGLNPKEASRSYPRVFMPRQERSQFPLRPIKVGRNEPCPCGSGKKYKRCCGQ
jgi:hypothetical protein